MKLVTYGDSGHEQPGVLVDTDKVVPLSTLFARVGLPGIGMEAVVGLLPHLRQEIHELLRRPERTVSAADVRLGPPVPRPGAIIAVGGNYAHHRAEVLGPRSVQEPTDPVIFAKPTSSVSGPTDDVVAPIETQMLDYECELAVVIGKQGRRISTDAAWEYVAGYMIANDVTARDVFIGQSQHNPLYLQALRGKGYDTFCPTGPWLVTPDEVGDPSKLRLQLWVNDELRQDATVDQMTFSPSELIAAASTSFTLNPGDILLTGTPPGVGMALSPPRYLTDGDVVRAEITGLGTMRTVVRAEEPPQLRSLDGRK
jgi:2,4-didehydro-3-deoxy-L-rhamnonate hydrolase